MVKSAERVLEILEYLRQSGPSKFQDIATAMALPKSSASMLLNSLVHKGYLDRDPVSHRYRPTYRVALLGEGIEARTLLGEGALMNAIIRLHRDTGDTVAVGLRNGAYVQYVHVLSRSTNLMRRLPVGRLRPLAYNPLGKVLLARLPEAEARLIIRHNNSTRHVSLPLTPETELVDQIAEIRRDGLVIDSGFTWPNALIIATAISPAADLPALAVAIGGLHAEFAANVDARRDEMLQTMAQWREEEAR